MKTLFAVAFLFLATVSNVYADLSEAVDLKNTDGLYVGILSGDLGVVGEVGASIYFKVHR